MPPESEQIQSRSLADWLYYLENQHHKAIDLGLERIALVAQAMQLTKLPCRVVTVAGTNGKGSTCRLLEQLLLALGYRVGVYSSPHLVDYRERVRLNDAMLAPQEHCDAFAAVEAERGTTPLTYFEFGTLAALWLFRRHQPDVVILEVGLGGRLDATNIVTPDVAVVTTVALDHIDWLGDDLSQIGREKAGIFRPGGRAVVGDPQIVASVLECANELNCQLLANGHQIQVEISDCEWQYHSPSKCFERLPLPSLPLPNAVAALACLEQLEIDIDQATLAKGLRQWQLSGRMQLIHDVPKVLLDVAHNPQSAGYLAEQLTKSQPKGRVLAVCAMLVDKEVKSSVTPLFPLVEQWYIAGLDGPRGDDGSRLAQALAAQQVQHHVNLIAAYNEALADANEQDLIIVFGSFFTVAAILEHEPNRSIGGSTI